MQPGVLTVTCWIHLLTLIFISISPSLCANFSIVLQTPEDCRSQPSDAVHQYYDISALRCRDCAQNATYQTTSEDGFSCTCQSAYRRSDVFIDDHLQIQCEECPSGQVSSADGYSCVRCVTGVNCQECSSGQLTAERDLTGERFRVGSGNNSENIRQCVTCVNTTSPSGPTANRCELCGEILRVQPSVGCACPQDRMADGVCFREEDDLVNDDLSLYTVNFQSLSDPLVSKLFQDRLRGAHAACVNQAKEDASRVPNEYSNLTACQLLGNLCALTLYQEPESNSLAYACSLHWGLVTGQLGFPEHDNGIWGIEEWKLNMPWIFYQPDSTDRVLDDRSIPVTFTPGMTLTFYAAKYSLEGGFLGLEQLNPEVLHMCKDTRARLDKMFEFGLAYKKTCDIEVDEIFTDPYYDTYFYDFYLGFTEDTTERLHAIPLVITNNVDPDADRDTWRLVRRFFLVDKVTAQEQGEPGPSIVRYASSVVLHVTLQPEGAGREGDGAIYTPYLQVTYSEATPSNGEEGDGVIQASFEVRYGMDTSNFDRGVAITTGVLCGLAVLYATLRTFTWNKRAGKIALDFLSLLMFTVFTAASLSTTFFIITFGFSLVWLGFYKGQAVFFMVPDESAEYYIQAFIGSAFALKVIHMAYLIISQVTVDIFFVDWERPHQQDNDLPMTRTDDISEAIATEIQKNRKNAVSIWRTYFVANQWNDIQTVRRVNPVIHMLLVLLLLYCVGLENLARFEPSATVIKEDGRYYGEYSLVLRFAVFTSIYILVAVTQRLFYWLIWSRFNKHAVHDFVDLCSDTNVSVFIMTHDNYGYYVHGRSPHGHTDVGWRQTQLNFKREEENLTGSRGLAHGEEQQTFEVAIPSKFRQEYNKVLLSVTLQPPAARANQRLSGRITVDTEKKLQAYQVLNKFLQAYIDHNIRHLDYIITEKNFGEKLLDSEFKDSTYVGYFYYDYGHAFDKALFYGHEASLQLFEVLLFTVVDMISYNYVLAGVITYAADLLLVLIRRSLGKRNLAKKTMVDERFLI